MHDHRVIIEDRLARFVRSRLTPALYVAGAPLTITRWRVPREPVPFVEARAQRYEPVELGTAWGRAWSTEWFHITGEVPEAWRDRPGYAVELVVDLGFTDDWPGFQAEGLVYTPDGITVKGVAPRNAWVPVSGREVDLYLEAAATPNVLGGWGLDLPFDPTELGDWDTAEDALLYRLTRLELALRDERVWHLQQDVRALDGLMRALPEGSARRAGILFAFERMLDAIDPDDVAATAEVGRAQLSSALGRPAGGDEHHVIAIGHAHIDSVWLWPARETIRKCARTFSNVVRLMDDQPDFRFACSSAQQLAWIQERYPELFERILEKVRTGQFIPVGGMWVESDTNLPGGEAMARQFVAGQRFFIEQMGVESDVGWLPDSFGYSAALPQILLGAGLRSFVTQKISWNQINRMPHHSFLWEGIDGSRIFTHFPPVDTYAAELTGAELAHAADNYREKGVGTTSLVPFGYGDGGGGPTREMVAAAERFHDLEGSPTVRIASPAEFFVEARAELPDPAVWSGELYLETARGTYTTQAKTKKGNRRSEHLLREAELWASAAARLRGVAYPYDDLERVWRLVLLQQFHDVLPGSSIAWVYRETEAAYREIEAEAEQIVTRSLAALAGGGKLELLANAAPHERAGVGALAIAAASPPDAVKITADAVGFTLDDGSTHAVIDHQGLLTSLVDLASGRDALSPGNPGNLLQLHRDTPNRFDAWDIDPFYRQVVQDLGDADAVELSGDGILVRRSFGSSMITQHLRLSEGALHIRNEIDWQEREKLLKLSFPFDVHAERATSEIQFGHVHRPTHTNTSWDEARFETVAQRWVHVGEPGWGVAIANDSTYGHDIRRSSREDAGSTTTVRLSLLRAPRFPDPRADLGTHVMSLAIRPGAAIADAVRLGYRQNLPMRRITGGSAVSPMITVSNPAVVVEAIKLAEDRSGDVIVRLYESLGARAVTQVSASFAHGTVLRTDLLERGSGQLPADGVLRLRPFELVTLRFPVTEP